MHANIMRDLPSSSYDLLECPGKPEGREARQPFAIVGYQLWPGSQAKVVDTARVLVVKQVVDFEIVRNSPPKKLRTYRNGRLRRAGIRIT